MAVQKPMLTVFDIHYRLESCEGYLGFPCNRDGVIFGHNLVLSCPNDDPVASPNLSPGDLYIWL